MEWLLVIMAFGNSGAPALGDSGYESEPLSRVAGQRVVLQLNAREQQEKQARTRVSDGPAVKTTTDLYVAKTWMYECIQVRKR